MKVRSLGSKKLKRLGLDSTREPGARPPHTVAVPVNPLQQAGGLHSCLSHPACCPEVLAAQGVGGGVDKVGNRTGSWFNPCTLGRVSHSLGLPLSSHLP